MRPKKALRRMIRDCSGVTLIELVVAMAAAAIITGAIISLFLLTNKSYSTGSDTAQAQNLAVLTMQKAETTLRYVSSVQIVDDSTSGANLKYDSTANGISVGGGTYLAGAFKGYWCDLSFDNIPKASGASQPPNLLNITVTIRKRSSSGNVLYTTSSSVYLLNGKVTSPANTRQDAVSYS